MIDSCACVIDLNIIEVTGLNPYLPSEEEK